MAMSSLLSAARQWPVALLMMLIPSGALAQGSAADYYVKSLPGVPADSVPIKMHAGHIEVAPETNGNMFFWHFENQHIANRQRTVIWINGGPGCSSEDGALMEIGPYRVQDPHNLVLNNGSWHEFANLLFVDNPVGTGFSYVDTNSFLHELDEMADQFVAFLDKFFALFPEYEKDDMYIAGESYAGQYIPYIAKAILDRNRRQDAESWNLRGLLIGNGWISPKDQYESYVTFANDKGLVKRDSDEDKQLRQGLRVCESLMSSQAGHVDYGECENILVELLRLTRTGNGDNSCVNMYDVRLKDSYPSCGMNWPPDLTSVTPYLRNQEVVQALHINPHRNTGWQECNGAVSATFTARNSRPSVELLPGIIEQIPILLFSGAEDLICNHFGTEELINNLEWNGGKGFEVTPGNWAPRRDWTFEGNAAGFWQSARNLTYVQFYNASHMVPFDWPRRTRDMLDRFMGVDISSVGGKPADSRIDGEKGVETTVGGAYNSTQAAKQDTEQKLSDAKWAAYQRSGEVVLVIVIIAAGAWGYFIWRQRRKTASYNAVRTEEPMGHPSRLNEFRRKHAAGDLEAAAFDENELDEFHVATPAAAEEGLYGVGEESDEEVEKAKEGQTSRSGSGPS